MSCWSVNSFDFTREKLNECSFFSAKSKESTDQQDMFKFFFNHASPFYTSNNIMNKSGVKRLNTLGHLDQYMAQHGRIVKQSYRETRHRENFCRFIGPEDQWSNIFTGPLKISLVLTIIAYGWPSKVHRTGGPSQWHISLVLPCFHRMWTEDR